MATCGWWPIVYLRLVTRYAYSLSPHDAPLLRPFCLHLATQLYMKRVMNVTRLDHFGAAYYNNILSLPFITAIVWLDGGLTGTAVKCV